jgi:hypothetical protein
MKIFATALRHVQRAHEEASERGEGSLKQPWHAVSVVVGGPAACPAAEGLRRKRFLSDEAPRLPLQECSCPWRCKCVYRHHADRRMSVRRETDRDRFPAPWVGKERREMREGVRTRGRRADDQTD